MNMLLRRPSCALKCILEIFLYLTHTHVCKSRFQLHKYPLALHRVQLNRAPLTHIEAQTGILSSSLRSHIHREHAALCWMANVMQVMRESENYMTKKDDNLDCIHVELEEGKDHKQ